jgi:ABC-type polysaccharide/polyol phosphate export permease
VIAIPLAIASISHDDTAILRDLFWPHQFGPVIAFGSIFLSLVPILPAYYNLGRLGAMLCLAVSFAMLYSVVVCAMLIFQILPPWLALSVFVAACLLLYFLLFLVHMKAAIFPTIRDSQRTLGLLRDVGSL